MHVYANKKYYIYEMYNILFFLNCMDIPPKIIDKNDPNKRKPRFIITNFDFEQITNEKKLKKQAEKEMVVMKGEIRRREQENEIQKIKYVSLIAEEFEEYMTH